MNGATGEAPFYTPPPAALTPAAPPAMAPPTPSLAPAGHLFPGLVPTATAPDSSNAGAPFDPYAALMAQPMGSFASPMSPFSSSAGGPGSPGYASDPLGPSGSTWTPGVIFVLLAPLIQVGVVFAWTQLVSLGALSLSTVYVLSAAALVVALFAILSVVWDRNALARRGYFDLASPLWVLLSTFIYLIIRAVRLRGQGRGGTAAVLLLVGSAIAAAVISSLTVTSFLAAPIPERVAQVESSIQSQLAAQGVTSTVSCPQVTSLAPGSVFTCSVTAAKGTVPVKVTIDDASGHFTVTTGTTGASSGSTA